MGIAPSLIRILTVDDHPLLRRGIAALVNTEDDMKLVAEASSGEEAIEKFRAHRPDVTLMDIQLPGLNGIETISQIQREFPNARIIVLTTYSGDVQVVRAIRAGARAFLLKRQVHRNSLRPSEPSMPDNGEYPRRLPWNSWIIPGTTSHPAKLTCCD